MNGKINKKRLLIILCAALLFAAVTAVTLLIALSPANGGSISESSSTEMLEKSAELSSAAETVSEETQKPAILTVRVLDIGQGDSILVQTPDRHNILIDTGLYTDDKTMTNLLISFGVETIDYMVLTHPHGDHIGNAAEVLKNFKTDNVIMIEMSGASYSYTTLLNELEKQTDINVIKGEAGYVFKVSNAEFKILSPQKISDNMNESSIVMRMTYGDNSMIFMGDVGETTEQWLMRNYTAEELRSDVIKIGHHGSRYSSTKEFLMTVAPTYAAISCGRDNEYGHPHSRVINTLKALGIETLRTDLMGTLSFFFYGDRVSTTLEH